jgi:hypothetical protein
VCGERTSFVLNANCSRLVAGLKYSRSDVVQYWAYADLLNVAADPDPRRRRFLYKDAGQNFRDVVDAVCALLDSVGAKFENLAESGQPAFPGRINDWKRYRSPESSITAMTPQEATDTPRAVTPIRRLEEIVRRLWLAGKAWWARRPGLLKREAAECEALGRAVLVLAAVEAVVKLVCKTEGGHDEDKFGVVQVHVENIINNMDLIHREAAAALQNGWAGPPFRVPWIARDHEELANQIVQMLEWAVALLNDRFGQQLDDEELSKIVKYGWIKPEEDSD